MRILIDLQACQSSGSRQRGIGRYSLALAHAMLRNAGSHEIHLLLSALFPETIAGLRQEFAGLLPEKHIHIWHSLSPVAEFDQQNHWRVRAGEVVREQAIAEIRPDVVHVSSLFEGLIDDALTSITQNIPTAVTLYDLIPLINSAHYLENPQVKSWYYRKIASLKRADLLLAISESSRNEGIEWLHLPAERVVNMSSAVDDRFKVLDYPVTDLQAMRQQYGLHKPYVMYTGGIDLRKNIDALIRAFAALPVALRQQYQLAIVCSVQDADRVRLAKIAKQAGLAPDDMVLTGFVPDQDLPLLYHACALFVFPSWHEGFGLPALEAMACGAPVIGANTSSLPEVIGRADAMFDPRSEAAITAKIQQALSDPAFSQSLRQHGVQQAKLFSWDASAKLALRAMEQLHERAQHRMHDLQHARALKPRLAYFSPLPLARSGISDYSATLLPELAAHYDIDLIVAQEEVSDPWLQANFKIRSVAWFQQNAAQYQRIVYNFGNSVFHSHMFDLLQKYPGVVVLHDFFMSGILAHLDLTGEKPAAWAQALYQSHGYPALLEKQVAENPTDIIFKYPCNFPLLNAAAGVIVHSDFGLELSRQWYGTRLSEGMLKIPHMHSLPYQFDKAAARQKLGLAEDDFLLCTFGLMGPTKLNHRLLDAWLTSALVDDVKCHLVFVGQNDGGAYGAQLLAAIKSSKARNRIKITGFADASVFQNYLMAADAAVQLRGLSRGETSYTALDCMAYGLPTIVNNNGSMAELPEHCLIKLDDQFDDQALLQALLKLRQDSNFRSVLGQQAALHIHQHHAPGKIAQDYFNAIERFHLTEPASCLHRSLRQIAGIDTNSGIPQASECVALAAKLAANRQSRGLAQICIDISELAIENHKNLAQLLKLLMAVLPASVRLEPVQRLDSDKKLSDSHAFPVAPVYSYARQLSLNLLGLSEIGLADEIVELGDGDVLLTFLMSPVQTSDAAQNAIEPQSSVQSYRNLVWDATELLRNFTVRQSSGHLHEQISAQTEQWQSNWQQLVQLLQRTMS